MRPYYDPCPATGRRVVTVAQWAARPDALIDEYAYWFMPEADEMGLDPWRLIEGIDKHTRDADYDVLFVGAGFRAVDGGRPIYILQKHWEIMQNENAHA